MTWDGTTPGGDIADGFRAGCAVMTYSLRPDNVLWIGRNVDPLYVEMTHREFEQITDGVSWSLEYRRPAVIVNADNGIGWPR